MVHSSEEYSPFTVRNASPVRVGRTVGSVAEGAYIVTFREAEITCNLQICPSP